jgi:hypothetical protein
MQTSHLPGGFRDLESEESEEREYLARHLEWPRIEAPITAALADGLLNSQRAQIDDAIKRAHSHIANCMEATPLALKLKALVELRSREGLTVIFPSRRSVAVAERFLARSFAERWAAIQPKLEWLALSDVRPGFHWRSRDRRLVVVGLSPTMLRLLLTHPDIPKGTHLLVPVQRAVSVVQTLSSLATVEPLKAYRARICGLQLTLKQQLDTIPDLENLTRALSSDVLSAPQRSNPSLPNEDPRAYCFRLEDGHVSYASGFVYRYDEVEGTGFTRVQARSVAPGDMIFEMSDSLRDEVEELLALGDTAGTVASSPQRKLLLLYHQQVSQRVASSFAQPTRPAQVRAIKARMLDLDSSAADVSESQITYWINVGGGDQAPHGARDHAEFLLFCRAIGLDEAHAELFWRGVRAARVQHQTYGRYLAACYAEIVFQPESAQVYRSIPPSAIQRLQAEARSCVFRVVHVEAPKQRTGKAQESA